MNEYNISLFQAIRKENIDRKHYTNSLIREAYRVGFLTDDDIAVIQGKIMEQLAEVIRMYTRDDSSSVRTDTAKRLMESLIFNIDVFLLSLDDHDKALAQLSAPKYEDLYGKGFLINKTDYERAKMLYTKARYSRKNDGSPAYNKVMDKDLYDYLKRYNPKFNAHDRLYVNLPEIGFRGSLCINRVVDLLLALIRLNAGRQSDIIL